MTRPVYALILAGGAGTRFWPASRALRPKQLLPLAGPRALLVETVRRVEPLCGPPAEGRVLVATGAHLAARTAELLPDLPAASLLVEPVPRNTAPCIAWAAARVARTDPDAVIVVLPSDHHVTDTAGFADVLRRAVRTAARGVVTTVGIRPAHPETGYGYIELIGEGPDEHGAWPVRRFVEKPDRARAQAFVESGRHLWNAGMFVFRARDMLEAVRAHLPALADGLARLDRAAERGEEARELERVFPELPAISIDYGVMEHLDRIAVVPGDFGWSDVGSWQAAWELAPKDDRGNAAPPEAVLVDASGNLVVDLREGGGARGRVIALVGVRDLVVVETGDALLVVPRDRAQDVKHAVDALKRRGDERLT